MDVALYGYCGLSVRMGLDGNICAGEGEVCAMSSAKSALVHCCSIFL